MYYENPAGVSVHAGFPNAATDASLQPIDLNTFLIHNSISTFMMRIVGNDWRAQGIFANDVVIIDRALKPHQNDLIVWWKDDAFAISPRHTLPIDSTVWGVVTATIHQYRQKSGQHHA